RKYGDEHPEYFAFVNGERRADVENDWGGNGTQPCLTNPEVLEIVTQGVLADLEKHPLWRNISVSMNDNRHYCRCPECRKVDEQAGSHMGALLKFVNEVARAVRKEHPDVMVGTLAYLWSRQPPKGIEPGPNVQIQLCSIECCLIHPISDPDCPMNVEFCRDLDGWSEICDKIYIWNYNTNFHNYLLPCPNLRVIGPNVKYFVEKGAKGLFMQAAGNTQGAELSGLRNYMIANLLWDPRRDAEKLKNEFLELHYSEAAPPIKEFIELVHDCAEASGLHNDCYGWAAGYGLDESVADAGIQAFEKAMELAESEELRRRVEKASICAYRLAIEPVALAAFQSPWKEMGARPSAEKLKELRPMVRHLFDLCDEYDVARVAEGMSVKEARNKLRKLYELQDGEDF
ncbi:MAG: DUF4838 domain-containing protein, partial [Planctomycetes bacterium]|nr:DUF4838 domain-containing protein [Planctomycetota bacterium]